MTPRWRVRITAVKRCSALAAVSGDFGPCVLQWREGPVIPWKVVWTALLPGCCIVCYMLLPCSISTDCDFWNDHIAGPMSIGNMEYGKESRTVSWTEKSKKIVLHSMAAIVSVHGSTSPRPSDEFDCNILQDVCNLWTLLIKFGTIFNPCSFPSPGHRSTCLWRRLPQGCLGTAVHLPSDCRIGISLSFLWSGALW